MPKEHCEEKKIAAIPVASIPHWKNDPFVPSLGL
jgi:hypothetical protein